MGGATGKLSNVFTGNDDMVNGTTQTAGQWKQDGLNNQDIKQLGTSPSMGTQIARGAVKAGMQGVGNMANQMASNAQPRGGGSFPPVIQPMPVPANNFQPGQYQWGGQQQNRNPLFGA